MTHNNEIWRRRTSSLLRRGTADLPDGALPRLRELKASKEFAARVMACPLPNDDNSEGVRPLEILTGIRLVGPGYDALLEGLRRHPIQKIELTGYGEFEDVRFQEVGTLPFGCSDLTNIRLLQLISIESSPPSRQMMRLCGYSCPNIDFTSISVVVSIDTAALSHHLIFSFTIEYRSRDTLLRSGSESQGLPGLLEHLLEQDVVT